MNKPILIEGSNPFFITKHNFMIASCADAYTLQVSVNYDPSDAANASWHDYSSTIPASDGPLEVGPVASNLWWRLNGNTTNVEARF